MAQFAICARQNADIAKNGMSAPANVVVLGFSSRTRTTRTISSEYQPLN
jgi:hypothetical protein